MKPDEWEMVNRGFQKRHLFAHKMGVVDDDYLKKANDPIVVKGRKVLLEVQEVLKLVAIVQKLGVHLLQEMMKLP